MLKKLARACGYDVKQWRWTPHHLRKLGPVQTVVDVGAAFGSWELYRAFPRAHLLLVEPLRDYEPSLAKIAAQYSCDIVYKALGQFKGQREIFVDPQILTRTSLHERTQLTRTGSQLEKRQIDITTLDSLLDIHPNLEGPILLKIDTEGHELGVIEGGEEFLKQTDVVIAEVSIARRFEGSYDFFDFIKAMDERGFAVFDFLHLSQVRGGPGTKYTDIAFVKKDSKS